MKNMIKICVVMMFINPLMASIVIADTIDETVEKVGVTQSFDNESSESMLETKDDNSNEIGLTSFANDSEQLASSESITEDSLIEEIPTESLPVKDEQISEQLDMVEDYQEIDLRAVLKNGSVSAWSLPYGYEGYINLGLAKDNMVVGSQRIIKRQATTSNGIYYEVKEGLWIHKNAFKSMDEEMYQDINIKATLKNGNMSAFSLPYNYYGYRNLGVAKDNMAVGSQRIIKRQATTSNGIYYEVKEGLWIHKNAFKSMDEEMYQDINIKATLKNGNMSAFSLPYNYYGYRNLGVAKDNMAVGSQRIIKRQATTSNGIYYEVKEGLWIHKNAFKSMDKESYQTVNIKTTLKNGNMSAFSLPYNYYGYRNLGVAKDNMAVGSQRIIKRQATTSNGIYYEVKEGLWIHKNAFKSMDKESYQTVNIKTTLKNGNMSAFSLPYNYYGYRNLGVAKDNMAVGSQRIIKRQATTSNGIYYEVKEGLWIHKNAFKSMDKESYKQVNFKAKLKNGNMSAFSLPYNYYGYRSLGLSKNNLKVGNTYAIKRQATTSNGVYYEAQKGVWVHKNAFEMTEKILDLPVIWQLPEMPSGCEATAVTMLINYATGKNYNKVMLTKQLSFNSGNPNVGYVGNPFLDTGYAFPPAFRRLVNNYVGSYIDLSRSSFNTLKVYINNEKPVVVWLTMHGFPFHAVTLTGYDANNVFFNDPWTNEKNKKMANSQFLNLWRTQSYRALSY
ncbi:hypothetical protein G7081_05255 [Vagococcus coleopterorum]|uniref:Peptidase C39-like domain-containing protein n=1 Tax=Vagococcus coleopterorum TaxID=2714946 RepID=A0A6G8ANH2_9ENTE|nr:C39 family peptidase [Vagococcus coleopterorum]QIL46520.1 hypothetical protein G7081_05255 [Vagococcus coleopterorum]